MEAPTEKLTNVDAAWLRMDEPGNLMVVNSVIALEQPIAFDRFRELVSTRLIEAVPRLRQRVGRSSVSLATPCWEPDPHFDPSYHVRLAPLDRADQASLQDLIGRLMAIPFEATRPLWTIYFVPSYEDGCAVIARFHHCIGDGLALLYLLLKSTDEAAPDDARPGVAADSWWEGVMRPLARSLSLTRQVEEAVVREVKDVVAAPARVLDAARELGGAIRALGRVVPASAEAQTIFRGPLSPEKRVAWSAPVPIATMKEIARVTGSTINDVALAAVAGALRQYLLSRGQPADVNLRAVVPVNLRPVEEASELGNRFGLVFVVVPTGIAEPLDRIFEVRARMREVKSSIEPMLTLQILRLLGVTPARLFDAAVRFIGARGTAVVTNVIAPRQRLHLGGAEVKEIMFWVPCSGRLGLGVSVLSYGGDLRVGVATDAGLVPDPARVIDFFEDEMSTLTDLAVQVRPEITNDYRRDAESAETSQTERT